MKDLRVSFPEPCAEKWDAMAPAGCNRACGRCETTVFDLSEYDVDQVETLLATGGRVCVRAHVDAGGGVRLKSPSSGNARRVVLAMGASAAMLMTGGQAAAVDERQPGGAIAGTIDTSWPFNMTITAKGDDGREYRGKVKKNGRYKIKKLPPGTYSLDVQGGCGDPWSSGKVTVREREAVQHNATDPNDCIIVGMIEIQQNDG
ncbi:MAG: carboxypeptidase regulatory-like domain-containing protein [Sphingopyxis sp.]|uniref:carboxypeptidase-like regulatory domain-containing protein n=1 Tax=Sphingopyxis sp. TaxID=1908224 RepID=UPI003D80E851